MATSSNDVVVRHDFEDGIRLDITLADYSYPVFLVDEPAKILADFIHAQNKTRNVAIICDENTAELFGLKAESTFISAGLIVTALTVGAGDETKSWNVAGQLLSALSNSEVERTDAVLSLGGGMVSDLAGFTAAIYMRGIDFYEIPTTLLALVDASIGGKVGVNREEGKNLAGAFKHPQAIAADVRSVLTLSDEEYRSGLAELAKTALLEGEEFLRYVEEHISELVNRDLEVLKECIVRCMSYKAGIVAADPEEQSIRVALNYGHTLGHALEKVRGFGEIPHGIAVAEGMRFASRLAVQLYGATPDFVRRQDALLDNLGLTAMEDHDFNMAELRNTMHADKKNFGGAVTFVLLKEPGVAGVAQVDDTVLFEHMRPWLGIAGYRTSDEKEADKNETKAASAEVEEPAEESEAGSVDSVAQAADALEELPKADPADSSANLKES